MADRRRDRRIFGEIMFPLNARQFSSTFLDFCRNSRGYGDDVRTEDKDATKRLLSPASAVTDNGATNKCTIPICHPLGNIMWDFVRQCTVVESQSRKQETDPLRACGWNYQREYDFINNNACQSDDDDDDEDVGDVGGGVNDDDDDDNDDDDDDDDGNRDSSGDNVDDDDDDIDNSSDSSQNRFHCVIEQASLSKETKLSSDLLNEVENRTRVGNNNFILDDGLCEVSAYWPSGDNGISDFSNGKHSGNSVSKNRKNSNESLLCDKTEMIKPLPLKKQRKYHGRAVSPSVTMNLKVEALNSVLNTETRLSRNVANEDVDICGKVAILYGSQETDSSHISVLESEVVGLYDYILGIVQILEGHGCRHQDNHGGCENTSTKDPLPSSVNTFVHLSAFLDQHHQISQTSLTTTASAGKVLKEHSPVAWLLTSPALGVTLDWQVEEHFLRLMQEWNFQEKEEDQRARSTTFLSQWQSVLVVVDEYRQLEKNIPQIEVYKLCSSGIIKLVNFDLIE